MREWLKAPQPSTLFAVMGSIEMGYWLVGSLFGDRPDIGFLGASTGAFAVWSALRKDRLRRDGREQRSNHDEGGSPPSNMNAGTEP